MLHFKTTLILGIIVLNDISKIDFNSLIIFFVLVSILGFNFVILESTQNL